MKLITERGLPLRLSLKPDFSEYVAPEPGLKLAQAFTRIRHQAAQGQIVIVRSDGRLQVLPALTKDAVPAAALTSVERLLPSSTQRNVAAIGDTSWAMQSKPTLPDAGRTIPFFGILIGFAAIGHAVWVFDAPTSAMIIGGCQEADLVVADPARMGELPPNWQDLIKPVMRTPRIFMYNREKNQLSRA